MRFVLFLSAAATLLLALSFAGCTGHRAADLAGSVLLHHVLWGIP